MCNVRVEFVVLQGCERGTAPSGASEELPDLLSSINVAGVRARNCPVRCEQGTA